MAIADQATGYGVALERRQAIMGKSGPKAILTNFRVFRVALFACIGGILYGYNQGMFSGVLAMPAFQRHMGEWAPLDPDADQAKKGWLTAILELGAWIGTLLSSFLAEILSRKFGILVACGVFIIGVVIQACAVTLSTELAHNAILSGRFITGMGVGALAMIIPIYNSEVAPPEVRGALVALQQLSICFGIMISFWIDYGTNFIGGTSVESQQDAAWLTPTTLQLFPALVLFLGMLMMPFSPRWLIHHNREADGKRVLASLRGLPEDNDLIELEFLEIKAQSLFEKRSIAEQFPSLSKPTAWNTFKLQFVAIGKLFSTRSMWKRIIVATVTMFFQQWTGINAVLYYAPSIFKQLGLGSVEVSLLATGVVGVVMFIATIPAVLWIDRAGRKPVLTIGALGMSFCHFVIAIILAKNIDRFDSQKAAGWAACCMVWLFVVHFGYSWGPCAWIIIAEIWPMSVRPYGVALGASSNWMNNFIVGQVTPIMLQKITYGTYLLFAILTLMGAGFIWFFVPETKRLTLEEMDLVFGSSGTTQADIERQQEIANEIGLSSVAAAATAGTGAFHDVDDKKEKQEAVAHADNSV